MGTYAALSTWRYKGCFWVFCEERWITSYGINIIVYRYAVPITLFNLFLKSGGLNDSRLQQEHIGTYYSVIEYGFIAFELSSKILRGVSRNFRIVIVNVRESLKDICISPVHNKNYNRISNVDCRILNTYTIYKVLPTLTIVFVLIS